MSVWNSSKATHIYTVSITYFVLKFYERFFKTRSIIHVTGTNIYIYIHRTASPPLMFCLVVEVTKQGHHHLCSLVIVVTTELVESQLGMPAFFE